MLVFGLIREDAFKIASVAAHDWSMMQDGDIHLLDLQRAKMRKNKVESHRLLSQQSLFDKSQNFYTMSDNDFIPCMSNLAFERIVLSKTIDFFGSLPIRGSREPG